MKSGTQIGPRFANYKGDVSHLMGHQVTVPYFTRDHSKDAPLVKWTVVDVFGSLGDVRVEFQGVFM